MCPANGSSAHQHQVPCFILTPHNSHAQLWMGRPPTHSPPPHTLSVWTGRYDPHCWHRAKGARCCGGKCCQEFECVAMDQIEWGKVFSLKMTCVTHTLSENLPRPSFAVSVHPKHRLGTALTAARGLIYLTDSHWTVMPSMAKCLTDFCTWVPYCLR